MGLADEADEQAARLRVANRGRARLLDQARKDEERWHDAVTTMSRQFVREVTQRGLPSAGPAHWYGNGQQHWVVSVPYHLGVVEGEDCWIDLRLAVLQDGSVGTVQRSTGGGVSWYPMAPIHPTAGRVVASSESVRAAFIQRLAELIARHDQS